MVEKEKTNLKKFDKYMREQGMVDWSGGPIKLEKLGEGLEFLLGNVILSRKEKGNKGLELVKIIFDGEYEKEKIVFYLEKRKNKDKKGDYYARVYIPSS